ncbi:MAG: polysaccharide deacetylase, partial [Pseudomonadota bacterium]
MPPASANRSSVCSVCVSAGGIYTCDLFHDDQPTPVRVRSGEKFISVPYSLEMNDTIVYVANKIEPRRYGEMLKANFDRLYAEGADNPVVMCIPLHAYQVSHPHRLRAFEEALEYITGHSDVWVTTGREIAEHWIANHYDAAVADIKARGVTA